MPEARAGWGKRDARKARLMQILDYIGEPQAVILDRLPNYKIIGVAIAAEGRSRFPFFGAGISLDQWEKYRRGFVDFRFLFMHPRWEAWFNFDLSQTDSGEITLYRTSKDDYAEREYVPEPGFFAYDHSEPIQALEDAGRATQKYKTDGKWDLPDFSEFYNKVTDIYAFHLALKKTANDNLTESQRDVVVAAFTGNALRGGASYVNLYSGLISSQDSSDRLSVGKLQYASAGKVDIRGRLDVFSEMSAAFEWFEDHYDEAREKYSSIYRFLSKNKLLRSGADRFDPLDAISDFLRHQGLEFASMMHVEHADLVYILTGRHALRFVKVMLAHFRRMEKYLMFFEQGRVKDPEIDA